MKILPGIQRINITNKVNGSGQWRFKVAYPVHSCINQIYRDVYQLMPGCEYLDCTSNERLARLDIDFGVDVKLNFASGHQITSQEKVLTTKYQTVTVEYYQCWRTETPGDWFTMKPSLYFVGYRRSNLPNLDDWILLDWHKIKLFGNKIHWQTRQNSKDGARASFRYAHFKAFPDECIVAARYSDRGSIKVIKNGPPTTPAQYMMF